MPIVRKHVGLSAQLAHERLRVGERDRAACRVPDVGDYRVAADRVILQALDPGRVRGSPWLAKEAGVGTFEKRGTPAVGMNAGVAAMPRKLGHLTLISTGALALKANSSHMQPYSARLRIGSCDAAAGIVSA